MRLHALFPTRDIGDDPVKIRDWAQAAEDLGFGAIEVPDHVFGATARGGWTPRYSAEDPFHETFTTMAFLAACTTRVTLSSGVLILPQRQTGVVAKQCAEVDLLSGGRVRLGIGVGWNHVEYEALGETWQTRGAKQAEQVEVLRRLWCEDLVTFEGRFHAYREINILPRPIQRPIPIWFGGSSPAVVRRAARLGDGWMPILGPDDTGKATYEAWLGHLQTFGRQRADVGMEAWLRFDDNDPQAWAAAADGWRTLGADIAMLYPMWREPDAGRQIETLRRFKEVAQG